MEHFKSNEKPIKVPCVFHKGATNPTEVELPLEHGLYHYELNKITDKKELVIDYGAVILDYQIPLSDIIGYKFFACGKPPLHYVLTQSMPLTTKEVETLEIKGDCGGK